MRNNPSPIRILLDLRIFTVSPIPAFLELPPDSKIVDALRRIEEASGSSFLAAGSLPPHFIVLLNGTQIELLHGVQTVLKDNDKLSMLSAVHGGDR